MATQTLEHCSLFYLNQWLTRDYHYHRALNGSDHTLKLKALFNAGAFYGVSRTLPKEHDENKGIPRLKPVLEILDQVKSEQFPNNEHPVSGILEIEREISEKYGDRNVLSLTTKMLWLKIRDPILIYDSQARIAVGTKINDLDSYHREWCDAFDKHEAEVKEVCSRLADVHLYAANQELGTKEYIQEISSESWFHKRVFDTYLWNKGSGT